MKVMREEESFKPVTIVLESQLEVDAMSDVAALMDGYAEGSGGLLHTQVRRFFSQLNVQLQNYTTDSYNFVCIEEPEVYIQYKEPQEENK